MLSIYPYDLIYFLTRQSLWKRHNTRYTVKWPKTAVTEIGPRDLICIQTSKWPQYFSLSFWAFLRFELQNGPNFKIAHLTDVENSKLSILVRSLGHFEVQTSKWPRMKGENI